MKYSAKPDHDILIVGGGACGLTAALALGQAGFRVALADAGPHEKANKNTPSGRARRNGSKLFDGRSTALLPNSIDFLEKLGIRSDIAKQAAPIHRLEIVAGNTQGNPLSRMRFDAQNTGKRIRHSRTDESLAYNIAHLDLVTALRKKVTKSSNINFFGHHVLTDLVIGRTVVRAIFATGAVITARLIVAADGRQSTVRHHAGIAIDPADQDKAAIVSMIDNTPASGRETCTEFHLRDGPLTLTPLPPVRVSGTLRHRLALVWVHQPQQARQLLETDPENFLAALSAIAGEKIGASARIGPRRLYPICPFVARRLIGPRLVLTGEAAHALPPTGAQGLNLSLSDIQCLTGCLENARNLGAQDVGASHALADYAQRRKNAIQLRYWASRGLDRWASARNPLHIALRAGVTRMIDQADLLKRSFIGLANL